MTITKQQQKSKRQGSPNTWQTGCCNLTTWIIGYIKDYFLFLGYSILYKRAGKCKQCGRCCRHVYLRDRGRLLASFHDCLEAMQEDSSLGQFSAKGKNDDGELFFGCNHVSRDNTCMKYKKRPLLCRLYPDIGMLRYGAIPKEDCGFYFVNRFTGKRVK